MKITPTIITAALAGLFSALAWPWLWASYGGASGGTVELVVGTLLLIGLPAHLFVVGLKPADQAPGSRSIDKPLLLRIAAWLAAALVASMLAGSLRG
ncbi:hypothetical protein J7U46_07450 [Pelomonas sp. V22]|uniref:hypothetical protein n=1 Tax=Pelomonas sp. V22 TaxID=2822139 RepID=UPI0024A8E4CE|nr:hypothetical protein [Pelomonas sp. V22]MDI4632880.1 hypothetical protein [Pelomonas sp. V22]